MLIEFFDIDGRHHLGEVVSQNERELVVACSAPVYAPALKNIEVGEIAVRYRIPVKNGRPQINRRATFIPTTGRARLIGE